MSRNRRETVAALTGGIIAPIVASGPFVLAAAAKTSPQLSPQEAQAIAKDIFLWGMHPVAIYHLRYNAAKKADRFATTPNATTLYGIGFYDLSKEPVVITVEEVKDRYWSIQLADNYARWWHLIGSQFNAPGPVRRLLIGPDWSGKIPQDFVGAEVVRSQSDMMCVLVRVALTDDTPDELKAVNAVQDRMTVISLRQWIAAGKKNVKAEDVPLTKAAYPTYPGMETVREPGRLKGDDFLRWASLVLNDASFTKQADGHKEIEAFA
ncbi:MAG: DUF1254 domain-containing protein, partial [Alphaproteobacteria bacterium]